MQEIENLKQSFISAYSAISFDPEKKAETDIKCFSAELEQDLKELGENPGNYKEKYLTWLRLYIARKGRTMSPMITGPANFPVARNKKRMDAELRAWKDFRRWRERYKNRAFAEKNLSPEDDILKTEKELLTAQKMHVVMIGVNKVLRMKKTEEEKRKWIVEKFGLSKEAIDQIFEPSYVGHIGFKGFELSYSKAKIKRLENKLITLRNRITVKESFSDIAFPGGSITISNDRVVVKHDTKPERTTIDRLKSKGFRWSPSTKTWVRKHTAQALKDAKEVCGIK